MLKLMLTLSLSSTALADRIITLNPALTEIVFALGSERQLVGVSRFSNFPEAAKTLPQVGDYTNPSIEKIVALKPDLVLLSEEGLNNITPQLRRAGLKWKQYKLKRLSDFEPTVQQIANDLHVNPKTTEKVLQQWHRALKSISPSKQKKLVMIQVEHEPLIVAGGDNFLSDLVTKCGASNIFSDLKSYPRINFESVLKRKPEIVLSVVHTESNKILEEIKAFWHKHKIGNITLKPDNFSRLSPRLAFAAQTLCQELEK